MPTHPPPNWTKHAVGLDCHLTCLEKNETRHECGLKGKPYCHQTDSPCSEMRITFRREPQTVHHPDIRYAAHDDENEYKFYGLLGSPPRQTERISHANMPASGPLTPRHCRRRNVPPRYWPPRISLTSQNSKGKAVVRDNNDAQEASEWANRRRSPLVPER